MKIKFRSKYLQYILMGVLAIVIFLIILDWESVMKGFNDGRNGNEYNPNIENTN